MNKFESKEPKERIISSSKGKGSITFFNDHLVFKLEYDHTPRKIEYRDIDKIIDKKRTWFYIIYLVVVLVSAGAIICYFFYEAFGIYNLITFSILLISTIVNFLEKGKLIQLKKEACWWMFLVQINPMKFKRYSNY